jgi:hypothetical protein
LAGKVEELVLQAKSLILGDELRRPELWRAYVAIEYAILDLKLRHRIEGAPPPAKLTRKNAVDLALARSLLDRIDLTSDEKRLLYDLRACRDVLKSLVANYERRSTTS